MKHKLNSLLKVGDRIKVWWSDERQAQPNIVTISRIEKYSGPLKYLWPEGVFIAYFLESRIGMTMSNTDYSETV